MLILYYKLLFNWETEYLDGWIVWWKIDTVVTKASRLQWKVIMYNGLELICLDSDILCKVHSITNNDDVGNQWNVVILLRFTPTYFLYFRISWHLKLCDRKGDQCVCVNRLSGVYYHHYRYYYCYYYLTTLSRIVLVDYAWDKASRQCTDSFGRTRTIDL